MNKFNNTTARSLTSEGELVGEIAEKVQFLSGMERVLKGNERSYMAIVFNEKGTGIENGTQYGYEEDDENDEEEYSEEDEEEEEEEEEDEEEDDEEA